MRHKMKKVTLDRKAAPRKALLSGLAVSLILYDKIITTKAKAQVTRSIVEKMVTKAKKNTLVSRRELLGALHSKNAVKKLMEVIGPRYATRKGGFTRVVSLNVRKGDGAQEALVEFV